jgi:hypothetical protein
LRRHRRAAGAGGRRADSAAAQGSQGRLHVQFGEYARDKDGVVSIDLNTTEFPRPAENKGYFRYKRLGTLPGGIHVLETWANGGGSGVFMDLLLVKFAVDSEYGDDGARRERLVMVRAGAIGLADRYRGAVTVKGNTVQIGADGVNVKKSKVLRIE